MGKPIHSYVLIRSKRRTLALQIREDGTLVARAPKALGTSMIESFIEKKSDWIAKHQSQILSKRSEKKEYSEREKDYMKQELARYLDHRVRVLHHGANLPAYTGIKVTQSERRWGSCNSRNSLCFSYRLAPYIVSNPRVIDAIIYHELAHLKEKNHSKKFWDFVMNLMPDYKEIMKFLR